MSVTYGFYNSFNGDRRYNAEQFTSIFDGLIVDGIFASIGTAFAVSAAGGLTLNVGIGRAWFNHTWTLNDSILPLTAPESELLQDRIDAVVLEVNSAESVRANSIKIITGTPSSTPARPTLENEGDIHQYPLAYIFRKRGSTSITQADITSMVGTKSTPFVTGSMAGKSAYEVAVDNGFAGTQEEWLKTMEGKSAYEVAVDNGFAGTQEEWLESLGVVKNIQVSTTDLQDGVSPLPSGTLYVVYE